MNKISRQIVNKIIEIHGSKDFKIAFLPYKRSMWNSMSSVYEECIASGIEAHVYPIPYLRMKENKQIDFIDSDRELFGDIAEDIEALADLHPDYIVIHYPYEDHNKVTNMLPEYFTRPLKERYKAKIIYIPYGIAYGNFNMHFSLQPGVMDVDYAFLESQENADRFVMGWYQYGVDFSGRVFGFGSPKLDVAANAQKEVPAKWEAVVRARQITLVSTSLSRFIMNPFRCLLTYQEEVDNETAHDHAVIFRPHPLLRTTIKSMLPHVQTSFDKLIEHLKENPDVIIDESEYLERAIGCADVLISDPSSVFNMWQATGKPCKLINDLEVG